MFNGPIALAQNCSACGARFARQDGAWVGAIAIGYGFGAAFGLALAFAELRWHRIDGAGLDPAWTIALFALSFTALGYRPAKAIWFGLLYRYGFMDTPADEAPVTGEPSGPLSGSRSAVRPWASRRAHSRS
jgi:hypothetical protein